MVAAATFHVLCDRDKSIFLRLREVFERVQMTNRASLMTEFRISLFITQKERLTA